MRTLLGHVSASMPRIAEHASALGAFTFEALGASRERGTYRRYTMTAGRTTEDTCYIFTV